MAADIVDLGSPPAAAPPMLGLAAVGALAVLGARCSGSDRADVELRLENGAAATRLSLAVDTHTLAILAVQHASAAWAIALDEALRRVAELRFVIDEDAMGNDGEQRATARLYVTVDGCTARLTGTLRDQSGLRIATRWARAFRDLAANPDALLGDTSVVLPDDGPESLSLTVGPDLDVADVRLEELFESQVRRTPDATAVVDATGAMTYRELEEAANALAARLIRRDASPETVVGVCTSRSLELIVSILAVLKSGAAYLPLDPAYPPSRLEYMVADARVEVAVTTADVRHVLPTVQHVIADAGRANPADVPVPRGRGSTLAYVIYTSGSTGRPKGVALEHRSVVAFLLWAIDYFGPDRLGRVVASTSSSFDLSIFEMFAPLACGGTAIIVRDLFELSKVDVPEGPLLVNTVPSVLRELLKDHDLPSQTRVVNLAGEALPPSLVAEVWKRTRAEVFNLYGPSEDTTYSTVHRVEPGAAEALRIPIGKPIANTWAAVVDEQLELVPRGMAGELCLGGAGLARGYLGAPALTASRFRPTSHGVGGGARAYRTGDRVRMRSDGVIDYLGRVDEQVKIRGVRVEPGEAEIALGEHSAVAEAAVVARPDPDDGANELVAFVVPTETAQIDPSALRRFLAARLPGALVPTRFVTLRRLPRTPTGKIDRGRLGSDETDARGPAAAAAVEAAGHDTEVARAVRQTWFDALQVREIGQDDNFFELGGHSLTALRVRARLKSLLDIDFPIALFMEKPLLREFTTALERMGTNGRSGRPSAVLRPKHSRGGLSWRQAGRLRRDAARGERVPNGGILFPLPEELTAGELRDRLSTIAGREDVLNIVSIADAGEESVLYADTIEVPISTKRANSVDDMERLASEMSNHAFARHEGPLWELAVIEHPDETGQPVRTASAVFDHLVTDGRSLRLFRDEVLGAGHSPEEQGRYRDWVRYQQEQFPLTNTAANTAAREFWLRRLDGAEADRPTPLPFCADPSAPLSGVVQTLYRNLPVSTADLQAAARRWRSAPSLVFVASLASAVSSVSAVNDVTLKVMTHGRKPGFLDTLGWFSDGVPLRVRSPQLADPGAALAAATAEWQATLEFHATPWDYAVAISAGVDADETTRGSRQRAQVDLNFVHGDYDWVSSSQQGDATSPGLRGGLTIEVFAADDGDCLLECEFDAARFAPDGVRAFLEVVIARLVHLTA